MSSNRSSHVLIVGIGSPHGDDQLGWIVVEAVAARLHERFSASAPSPVMRYETRRAATPADLLDWLPGPTRLILIDACAATRDTPPWQRLTGADVVAPRTRSAAGHLLGLPSVLELAKTLGRLPDLVEVWAIRGDDFSPGGSAGEGATARGRELAELVAREIAADR